MCNKISHTIASIVVIISLTLGACNGDPTGPSIDLKELTDAPLKVQISGRDYTLETYLWRDFQPIAPPEGQPLIAIVWIVALDSLPISENLSVDGMWIVNGSDIWEATYSEEHPSLTPDFKLELVARDGPLWGPGIEVDLIVSIRENNARKFLRATDQLIARTD